jgi:CO/xanthine dehydrogenase FAD-binding subunit
MFEFLGAKTAKEAFKWSNQYGEKAKILAGGTELLVNIRQKAIEPQYLISIKKIPNFNFINYRKKTGLKIGALTLLHDIDRHPDIRDRFTALGEAAHEIGSLQIRNMGTIGGNICQDRKCVYYNQSHIDLFMRQSLAPCWARGGSICHAAGKDSLFHSLVGAKKCWATCCSDMLTALVCFDGSVEVRSQEGVRTVMAEEFWPGPHAGENALKPNELVSAIHIPDVPAGTHSTYLKYKRDSKDFAVTSVAVRVHVDKNGLCAGAGIVLGGVAPVPLRVREVEEALKGKRLEEKVVEEAAKMVLKDAKSRGPSTEFKIIKTRSLMKDAFNLLRNK